MSDLSPILITDTGRLNWLLRACQPTPEGRWMTASLKLAQSLGLSDRAGIDYAMKLSFLTKGDN